MKKQNISIVMLVLVTFVASSLLAQALEISGTVTERKTGEILPGANVQVKGTNLGTATDRDGKFNMRLPNFTEATLVVSFIGYKTQEVNVSTSISDLPIVLEEDVLKVSEVVVTGLATSVKRRSLANSVGTVSSKELATAPTQTLERALNGKIAGISVSQNTGAPGGGIYVNLRGTTTIEGSTDPLYVVDGVIVNNSAIQSGIDLVTLAAGAGSPRPQGQPTNRIADINPNDIENIEVLKGSSAAAIYGSKASNGVIIITTKHGAVGKTRIDVTQQMGFNSILRKIGSRRLQGQTFIDYEELLYGRNGFLNETGVSARGGSERTQFYIGGLFQDEDGIVENTGYQKFSGKLNVNHSISERLKVSLYSTFARTESDRSITGNENAGSTTLGFAQAFTPSNVDLRPQQLNDGTLVFPDGPAGSNPLHTIQTLVNNETVYRTIGSARLNWNVMKTQQQTLDFIVQAGIDYYSQGNQVISPPELQFEQRKDLATRGQAINGETESTNSNLYLQLAHNMNTSSNIVFRSSAGVQFENQNRNSVAVQSLGLVSGQQNADQAASAIPFHTVEKQRERGFYAQEEIDLQEKVYLTLGLRGDASSANGETDKYYLFPKASVSFRLSQFWPGMTSFAEEFKLRAAYGETGNLPPANAKFTPGATANIGGGSGVINPIRRGFAGIQPERSKEIEVGFDATLLKGNATLEFSYYRRNIVDLILINELPPSSGFEEEIINGGEMRTHGIEVSLGLTPIRRDNLNWTSRLNFYKSDSEVTDLVVDQFFTGGFALSLGQFLIAEGKSPTTLVGLDEAGNVAEFGNENPDFQMSLNNNFTFVRNLELSFLWDWKKGGNVINLGRFLTDLGGTSDDLDTPAGQARLNGTSTGRYIESGSYLKLRELSLSYSLPASVVRSLSGGQLSYLRLGISGRNLIMITDYSGYDPEVSQFGNLAVGRSVDVIPYPSSRSYYFNIAFGL
jgi:TonB-dependent SusC/RagA subfamily outer membrane receptor